MTLRQGNSASVWKTKPILGSMPDTGPPITRTIPALGLKRPVTRLSVVDLPQPVGPTTAANSPRLTVMVKSWSAVSDLPSGERNRRVTLISSIAGAAAEFVMGQPIGERPAPR